MKAPNGRLSGDGSVQARRHEGDIRGSYPQIFSVLPQIFCAQKNLFQTYDNNKNFPPLKMYVALLALKPGYWSGSAKLSSKPHQIEM